MKGNHVIKDIRYFASGEMNAQAYSVYTSTQYVGSIYHFPNTSSAVGQRIARKLHQYGFVAGSFDHVYISFCPYLEPDELIAAEEDRYFPWFRYFSIGLLPERVNALHDDDKEKLLAETTFNILERVYPDDERKAIIQAVREEYRTFHSELEILYMDKETTKCKVTVSFQIKPLGKPSCILVKCFNKETGEIWKKPVIEIASHEEVYYLIDRISLKEGIIQFQPKKSFRASIYNERYEVPIRIPISCLKP